MSHTSADITIIGPVTRDMIFRDGVLARTGVGGVPYYAGLTAAALGASVRVITRVAPADEDELLLPLREMGVDVVVLPSLRTLIFENHELAHGERKQKIRANCDGCDEEEIHAWTDSRITILGPLLSEQMPRDWISASAGMTRNDHDRFSGQTLYLDSQGLLRLTEGEHVRPARIPDFVHQVASVDVVKLSQFEATLQFPGKTFAAVAAELMAVGVKEVLITRGGRGCEIYSEVEAVHVPAQDLPHVHETTGCGDIFLAAYAVCRARGESPTDAGVLASRMAGLRAGDFRPWHEVVGNLNKTL